MNNNDYPQRVTKYYLQFWRGVEANTPEDALRKAISTMRDAEVRIEDEAGRILSDSYLVKEILEDTTDG